MSLRSAWAAQQDHFSEALTSDGALKKTQISFIKAAHGRGCGREQSCWSHSSLNWMERKKRGWGLISAPRVCPPWLEDLLKMPPPPVDARLGVKPLTCGLGGGTLDPNDGNSIHPHSEKNLKQKLNFTMENLAHNHYLQEEHRQQTWRRLRWVKTQENLMVPYLGINILKCV